MDKKISFASDYLEGAHEAILRRFGETAKEQLTGYGTDKYTKSAAEKIAAACECETAQVVFIGGGTQTNQLVIDTMLAPYEGVVAAQTGHVAAHEAGAIEFSGHKVLTLPHKNGKICAADVDAYVAAFWADDNHEHMVFPGMVYISHPTEFGTLYTKDELCALSQVCHKYDMPLFLDGARLGYGLMSDGTDVDLPTLAKYCDVFYIGGTKVGALCGEAVVFTKGNMPKHFTARQKQHGALLAKGWVTGLQFDTLFTDGLYFKIARHAIELANYMKAGLQAKGYEFYIDSPTNQQFLVLDDAKLAFVREKVGFSYWEPLPDGRHVIRLATSWATTKEMVDTLLALL